MNPDARIKQYLDRYVHNDSREAAAFVAGLNKPAYERVLCIPIFDEHCDFLNDIQGRSDFHSTLIILVINAPTGANHEAHQRTVQLLLQLRASAVYHSANGGHAFLLETDYCNAFCSILVMDCCTHDRMLPAKEGVGLARKLGNDVALELWRNGQIKSPWLYQTDGDATLPNNYFNTPSLAKDAVAVHLDFEHVNSPGTSLAQRLYDLKLDYYVAGLTYAGSHYNHYSLGSAIVIHAEAYAIVRGYPKRSAGEDFYVLNKLAKYGTVVFDRSRTITLQERLSTRVPFGTGPGVAQFAAMDEPLEASEYYSPDCFEALRNWLVLLDSCGENEAGKAQFRSRERFHQTMNSYRFKDILYNALSRLKLFEWLDNTVRNNSSTAQVRHQMRIGMDGLKTLQLIHALRDNGLSNVSAPEAQDWLFSLPPSLLADNTRLGGDGNCGFVFYRA